MSLFRSCSVAAAILWTTAASAQTAARGELAEKLDAHVSKCADAGFSGVVLVAKDGQVLLRKGYGMADREKNQPNAADMALCIGSNTKMFTAAAILKLEEAGKLSVSDTLSKFFPDAPPDKREITIHQMLSHSSGLGEYHDNPGEGGDFAEMSRDEAVKRILAQPLRCKPGSAAEYSNCAYTLLAVIIEQLSGTTWEAYLRKSLFEPAGMKHTGFFGEKLWKPESTPRGYGRKTKDDNRPTSWPGVTWALKGAGGMVSTADDLLAWHNALRGDTVLGRASKEKAFRVHVAEGGGSAGEGYGWIVMKTPRNTTALNSGGGSDFGFTSGLMRYVEENVMIVVLSNSGEGGSRPVLGGIPPLLFPNVPAGPRP
jgi:CubicO group peptidase (beta-lactamase class C family)